MSASNEDNNIAHPERRPAADADGTEEKDSGKRVKRPAPVLYHAKYYCSSIVAQLVHELGLGPDKIVVEEIDGARLKSPEMAAINPAGKLPILHDEALDMVLVESGAIVEWILENHDQEHLFSIPADGSRDRAKFLQYLYLGPATGYHYACKVIFNKDNEEIAKKGAEEFDKYYMVHIKKDLADGRDFLVGNRFTAADIVTTYELMTAKFAGLESVFADEHVAKYFERLSSRPAYAKLYL